MKKKKTRSSGDGRAGYVTVAIVVIVMRRRMTRSVCV
jgi:hypothetical protein